MTSMSPLVDVVIAYVISDMPNLSKAELLLIRDWLNFYLSNQISLIQIKNKFIEKNIPTNALDKLNAIMSQPDHPIPYQPANTRVPYSIALGDPNSPSNSNLMLPMISSNSPSKMDLASAGNPHQMQDSNRDMIGASNNTNNLMDGNNNFNNSNDINNYDTTMNGARKKIRSWTLTEDQRLLLGIHRFGLDNWALVSEFVGGGRTRSQCSQRWLRGLDPHIIKDHWRPDDDEKLLTLVALHGNKSWTQIAEDLGNRCDVQCRYRYRQLMKNPRFKHQMKEAQEKAKDMKKVAFHRKRHVRNRSSSNVTNSTYIPTQSPQSTTPGADTPQSNITSSPINQQNNVEILGSVPQTIPVNMTSLQNTSQSIQNLPNIHTLLSGVPNLPSAPNIPSISSFSGLPTLQSDPPVSNIVSTIQYNPQPVIAAQILNVYQPLTQQQQFLTSQSVQPTSHDAAISSALQPVTLACMIVDPNNGQSSINGINTVNILNPINGMSPISNINPINETNPTGNTQTFGSRQSFPSLQSFQSGNISFLLNNHNGQNPNQ
ncbi:hypothetical protein TRFO_15392 [Tritrichomonas foetus]|uniref:Myb-like DNA-binding domain containing protein n=1 Tax=Tritrichomonas foetus TaxID=1144522 RepID=A0A1J4KXA4_9EUKA|nr:hypothetical protein TRFO_15392 [Tritrichomonas foetus]|eukprot:OHT14334.1 hypothetical protein TRFO_15392 [Tritrichomonas foetus]